MEYLPHLTAIAGVFLLGVISPGPNFVLVTTVAARSRAAAISVAAGFCLAALTWSAMSAAGLAVVLSKVGWAYTALRLVGAAYLVYLGIQLLFGSRQKSTHPKEVPRVRAGLAALRSGYLTNIANPKSAVFFTSVFATMLPADAPAWLFATTVTMTGIISLSWYVFVAVLFSTKIVQSRYRRIARGLDRATGVVLIALGVRMAASR